MRIGAVRQKRLLVILLVCVSAAFLVAYGRAWQWSAIRDAAGAAKEFVLIVIAAAGAVYGYLSLRLWREQSSAKIEHELARDLLRAAFKIRLAFPRVRNLLMFKSELDAALDLKTYEGLDDESKKTPFGVLQLEYLYRARLRDLDEGFSELQVKSIEAEVLWGDTLKSALHELWECRFRWTEAVRGMLEALNGPDPRSEQLRREDSQVLKVRETNDAFAERIDAAIAKVEDFLRPRLLTHKTPGSS